MIGQSGFQADERRRMKQPGQHEGMGRPLAIRFGQTEQARLQSEDLLLLYRSVYQGFSGPVAAKRKEVADASLVEEAVGRFQLPDFSRECLHILANF